MNGHAPSAAAMLIEMLYGGIQQFVEAYGYGPNVDVGNDYSLETSYYDWQRGKYNRRIKSPTATRGKRA